jgi:hypothetical protein
LALAVPGGADFGERKNLQPFIKGLKTELRHSLQPATVPYRWPLF